MLLPLAQLESSKGSQRAETDTSNGPTEYVGLNTYSFKLAAIQTLIPSIVEIDRARNDHSFWGGTDHPVEQQLRHVAQSTAGGILLGMLWGGYRGLKESTHIGNVYAEYSDIQRPYRMPVRIAVAANASASTGWKLGFLAGSFTAAHIYIRLQIPELMEKWKESENQWLYKGGEILGNETVSEVLPTAGAGTLIGTMYGGLSGGFTGAARGLVIGAGLSSALGVAHFALERTIKMLEAAQAREQHAKDAFSLAKPWQPHIVQGWEDGKHTKAELQQHLATLREKENTTGTNLAQEKAEIKRRIKSMHP